MQQGIECTKWFDKDSDKGFVIFEFSKQDFERYLNESEALDDERRNKN